MLPDVPATVVVAFNSKNLGEKLFEIITYDLKVNELRIFRVSFIIYYSISPFNVDQEHMYDKAQSENGVPSFYIFCLPSLLLHS